MKTIAAILLIFTGLLLRFLAMRALGKDFSLTIKVPSRVVKTGIYKYDRHPAYAGSMMIIIGASLISELLGIVLTAYAFFKSRMVVEDEITRMRISN